MSLSKIDKEHANELLLAINQHNVNHNALEVVRTNYMQYGKLKQIAKQMQRLQEEAQEILEDSMLQHTLQSVECRCKKISGTTYHLYTDEKGSQYFSLISPKEWKEDFKHIFSGSFYYDFDKTFVKQE
jgi:hypothetical protein